jgi:hypothetical protein
MTFAAGSAAIKRNLSASAKCAIGNASSTFSKRKLGMLALLRLQRESV